MMLKYIEMCRNFDYEKSNLCNKEITTDCEQNLVEKIKFLKLP